MDQPTHDQPPRDRRTLLLIGGAAVALLAGVTIAWLLLAGGRRERSAPPPASQAGLIIESGPADGKIDPAKPLRCFVAGQFVGELTLTECARRNGVATDSLDVGLDETGALAASQQAGMMLTPLPPEEAAAPAVTEPAPEPPAAATGTCWRHAGGQWRRLADDTGLDACVQSLFAGRCERPGQASYGRWGQQTLRLVTGRVEISSDNQVFRTLAAQGPNCSLPTAG